MREEWGKIEEFKKMISKNHFKVAQRTSNL